MSKRVLIAGVGNVFLGDDAGVEVVKRLAGRALPEGVEVVDFGIRGWISPTPRRTITSSSSSSTLPREARPGTVYLIEPEIEDGEVTLDTHGMDPVKVMKLARARRQANLYPRGWVEPR
jgi:hydrogenase maturation protease